MYISETEGLNVINSDGTNKITIESLEAEWEKNLHGHPMAKKLPIYMED